MAHIIDIGSRFYVQKLYWHVDQPPLVHKTHTTETEYPYRTGRCIVLRVPFRRVALVLGMWVGHSENEEEALLNAMDGRVTKDNGIRLDEEMYL